jgi:hypothetical protein
MADPGVHGGNISPEATSFIASAIERMPRTATKKNWASLMARAFSPQFVIDDPSEYIGVGLKP